MKKVIKTVLSLVLVAVLSMVAVACGGGNADDGVKGVKVKKFKGDAYHTVVNYVAEEDVTVLDLGKVNDDEICIGRIQEGAFDGNQTIEEIIVPASVVEIDEGAFKGMKNLKKITLPFVGAKVKADAYPNQTPSAVDKAVDNERNFGYIFGSEEFEGGAKVETTLGQNTVTYYIPSKLYQVNIIPSDDYVLPMYAFYGMTQITKVSLGEKVKYVGDYAFNGFSSLKEIEISKDAKLEYIGEKAFVGTSIKSFSASVKIIKDYAFANVELEQLQLADVESVGYGAFIGSEDLLD